LGNCNSGGKEVQREEESTWIDVNMVFTILAEFCVPMKDVTVLELGDGHAVFEKSENPGAHMKPLFIQGHLDGMPIRHRLVDGGTSINISAHEAPIYPRTSRRDADRTHVGGWRCKRQH
jgi:hypothetical protein